MSELKKPCLTDEKNWDMTIRFDGGTINLVEEGDTLGHYLGDVTEECITSVLFYGRFKATEMCKDYVQFSHPTSGWIIEVRKKNMPRYKKLFYIFK